MIPMRLPVTRNRRCVQITAFGASDVPDVKISPQSVSGPGSTPASLARRPRRARRRGRRRAPDRVGSAPVRKRDARRAPPGARSAIGASSGEVPGLGDHQVAVGVLDVAQEVLVAARVVEADDRRARERGATEREEVVGGVVEQHPDVRAARRARRAALEEAGSRTGGTRRRTRRASTRGRRTAPRGGRDRSGSVGVRRSSAAASAAGIGASPGAGTARSRRLTRCAQATGSSRTTGICRSVASWYSA